MLQIKEIAKKKGLTMEALAKKLDINRVTLSRNINGNPTIETLQKIADALNVEVRDLIQSSKEHESKSLYIKNDQGELVQVGTMNREYINLTNYE